MIQVIFTPQTTLFNRQAIVYLLTFSLWSFDVLSAINYEKIRNNLVDEYQNEVKCSGTLQPIGQGYGGLGELRSLSFSYAYHSMGSLSQTRQLLVAEVQKLVHRVNMNLNLRPYMHDYPFTPENIEYDLHSFGKNIIKSEQKSIIYVALKNGIITYKIRNYEGGKNNPFFYKETFEEAARIVRCES